MDSANADSDHSMTWEDFFGSTTDLTPTLIGIYDSLLEPEKKLEKATLETAKDARNYPPVTKQEENMIAQTKDNEKHIVTEEPESHKEPVNHPTAKASSFKLPIATINKSSLYSMRTTSVNNGASDIKSDLPSSDATNQFKSKIQRTFVHKSVSSETKGFDNLSPNVKRMISSAGEAPILKFQKKTGNVARSSTRRTNIPLVGATSKISQSGVDILPTVDIYDQPCGTKTTGKLKPEEESPTKIKVLKPEFRLNEEITYDVPTNNMSIIYDIPNSNKTAYESLSLPYIDQSIELSITTNDREFDTKLPSKDNSPQKPDVSPAKVPKVIETPKNLNRRFTIDSPTKLPKPVTILEAGSVGNLKAEKEVSRLNPPSVEVTRPLSMSSIASSSSTSSSGVQNKGGVNSAYLASIESLDDHSDASATGSNNFMNNAGVVNMKKTEDLHTKDFPREQASDEMAGLSQLERVCAEIVQTENVYVEDLRQVVEGYLHEWRREATFSEEELAELFNNIEDIYTFNRSLCEELNTCCLDATSIARCFVSNTAGFSVYTSYCTGYPRTMQRLAALASDSNSARQFRERQLALGHPLPLASYLLKPVQRILKYHLLLQKVVKQCASSETEYALLKMTRIAQHIDDMKRKHEHAVRVQEIQSLLYGWSGPDLTTYGELCAEGTFRVFGAKAMRHAFLFDKLLLITKNREDGILAYKSHIMCNNLMLVESIAGAPLSFQVIPWDAPRSHITLQARSLRHKREWALLLKQVILENYNVVIPQHARRLVMELGQNKTDDDILAEKSHNLITQASMRKQMSAPEYLEKRKLERERRKLLQNGIQGRFKKNRKYTVPNSRTEPNQECDCAHISGDKSTDYTCDNCYIDLCSDCEAELISSKAKEDKCGCQNEDNDGNRCPECEQSLRYIDAGSAEHLERKHTECKCSDFQSSQESFGKEFNSLNKTRGYHSSDNIVGYTDNNDKEANVSMTNVRSVPKTCLKCSKIKENIVVTDSLGSLARKSRCIDDKHRSDALRSKSKDDPQRSRFSNKIGTWRRKSEPGLQQNSTVITTRKSQESDSDRVEYGSEKIEFECRNCGSNKITRRVKISEGVIVSDQEFEKSKGQPGFEVKMYTTKNIPKKISKLKKNKAKGLRPDMKSKFYADFSTDLSTENILHISESNDSLHESKVQVSKTNSDPIQTISKDEDIDEETYKKLLEKTDSFKKNELEKVQYSNKQKVINEGTEAEEKCDVNEASEDVQESCDETEQPLEQIISQLLSQNREFQKLIKKQQQKKGNVQKRHQRLLKSHSTLDTDAEVKENDSKLKFRYERQMSKHQEPNVAKTSHEDTSVLLNDADNATDDEHIYETLRVENNEEKSGPTPSKNEPVQNRLSSTQAKQPHLSRRSHAYDDYVYLSFDQTNTMQDDGIYDVPVKSPPREDRNSRKSDYYVSMENNSSPITANNNLYDELADVCKRQKEAPNVSDYLPMSPDQQNPNNPEIWLSRQKEHFNLSRDRKSGSLPRSFQIPTPTNPEDGLTTFKPSNNNKTYLNKEGKVMSIDRPFTIASDQSEISFDDVENYMNESDMIKFSKQSSNDTTDSIQDISQSTLELEEEIDRCYKNNFQTSLDTNKNENLLTVSQADLDISNTSSCEVLTLQNTENKNVGIIHPDHKIYKNTNNLLSIKNVLSRFKNRGPNKINDDEVNENFQSTGDNSKSDLKSPISEKRSGLNPRSYSRNLLQRFKSIIGDEHSDDNQNKTQIKTAKDGEDNNKAIVKSDIEVVITSSDVNLTTSLVSSNIDALSKSVFEPRTFSESHNEKSNLEALSHSCDNIQKSDLVRPNYGKSISMVTNISTSSITSSLKSSTNSNQNLNKFPIYMQGSKNLGARIAQSDYVDPTTFMKDKLSNKAVNVLINKNAVRPDSLFSNSSFVTSSSESTYVETHSRSTNNIHEKERKHSKAIENSVPNKSDESFYEKSFEKIEHVVDDDVFRDSAVYSDQEDSEDKDVQKHSDMNISNVSRSNKSSNDVKRNSSIKSQISISSSSYRNTSIKTRVTCKSQIQHTESRFSQSSFNETGKPKVAPPVPIKPKITNIPVTNVDSRNATSKHLTTLKNTEQSESFSTKTIKRNISLTNKITPLEKPFIRSNSKELEDESKLIKSKDEKEGVSSNSKPLTGIQLKRMSFERASLDSATRRLTKSTANENKRSSFEPPKTAKSVLERRIEIELMAKGQLRKTTHVARKPIPNVKPKSITTKVANFEKNNVTESSHKEINVTKPTPSDTPNITTKDEQSRAECVADEVKGSWVKQVVNKFQ